MMRLFLPQTLIMLADSFRSYPLCRHSNAICDKETDISHFVNEQVLIIPGIQDTHTIITFKAFGWGNLAAFGRDISPPRKTPA